MLLFIKDSKKESSVSNTKQNECGESYAGAVLGDFIQTIQQWLSATVCTTAIQCRAIIKHVL
jgi:hypothetical protein